MPQVSIVVPIYNVERYLSYCLDTLRAQTLRDIEIICVNDGSPDHSAAIAEAHASLDKRIRVINKPNGGLSSARNAGINAARGDYLMFVDSDDYLAEEACESVVSAFESNNADIVTFGAHCVPQKSNNDWLDCVLSPRDRVYREFTEDLLFAESSRPFAWRTAVRKQFIDAHELRFDESVPFGEDQVFHFDIYPLARTTALISDKLYYYRLSRKDSLMLTFANSSKWRVPKHIDIVGAILTHWDERGLDRLDALCASWIGFWTSFATTCFDFLSISKKNASRNLAASSNRTLKMLLRQQTPSSLSWATSSVRQSSSQTARATISRAASLATTRASVSAFWPWCVIGFAGSFRKTRRVMLKMSWKISPNALKAKRPSATLS